MEHSDRTSQKDEMSCPWIKKNLGIDNETHDTSKSAQGSGKRIGASKVPAVSLSMYDVHVDGVSSLVSMHINPGELVAIMGNKTSRQSLINVMRGTNLEAENG